MDASPSSSSVKFSLDAVALEQAFEHRRRAVGHVSPENQTDGTAPRNSAVDNVGVSSTLADDAGMGEGEIARMYLHVAGVHDHHHIELNQMVKEGSEWRGTVDVPNDAYCSVLIAAVPASYITEYENPETFDSRRRLMELLRYSVPAELVQVEGVRTVEPARFPRETLRIEMPLAPTRPGWGEEWKLEDEPAGCEWSTTSYGWKAHPLVHGDRGATAVSTADATDEGSAAAPKPSDHEGLGAFSDKNTAASDGVSSPTSRGPALLTSGDDEPHSSGASLILLDGQQWVRTPLLPALYRLYSRGLIPPISVYAIDTAQDRVANLGSNVAMHEKLEELIVAEVVNELTVPDGVKHPVIIAGQSLGGLTAVEFALAHPELVSGAIANSGSFWWPDRRGEPGGQVARNVRAVAARHRQLRSALARSDELECGIYLSVGTAEGGPANAPTSMAAHTREVYEALREAGICEVEMEMYSAAHEMAAWEGALVRGLLHLLRPCGYPRGYKCVAIAPATWDFFREGVARP